LGANPFVGLTRGQLAAALARVAQRAAVEPGAVLATGLATSATLCESPSAAATSSAIVRDDASVRHPVEALAGLGISDFGAGEFATGKDADRTRALLRDLATAVDTSLTRRSSE
jgi:hypothetical protein